MQRTVDVTTARRQFGTLLDEVFYKGDVITIERKGKPLAWFLQIQKITTRHRLPSISKGSGYLISYTVCPPFQ